MIEKRRERSEKKKKQKKRKKKKTSRASEGRSAIFRIFFCFFSTRMLKICFLWITTRFLVIFFIKTNFLSHLEGHLLEVSFSFHPFSPLLFRFFLLSEINISIYIYILYFPFPFDYFFKKNKSSLHSDPSVITRVTVDRDINQSTKVFEFVQLILRL